MFCKRHYLCDYEYRVMYGITIIQIRNNVIQQKPMGLYVLFCQSQHNSFALLLSQAVATNIVSCPIWNSWLCPISEMDVPLSLDIVAWPWCHGMFLPDMDSL